MINFFRIIAFLEGLSYLLLLVAMPIKYMLNDATYVKLLGMPHGILFIVYVVLAIWLKPTFNWTTKQFLIVLVASLLPLGTFYVEYKYLKHHQA